MPQFYHGKDNAMAGSNFNRRENDLYETPEWVTEALMPHLFIYPFNMKKENSVWDPCCGRGKMVKVLERFFSVVIATDKVDYGIWMSKLDFLTIEEPQKIDAIITNPPYGRDAESFIRQALYLSKKLMV